MRGRFWGVTVTVVGLLGLVVLLDACSYVSLPGGLTVNWPTWGSEPGTEEQLLERVELPDGFHFDVFASDIYNARLLRFTDTGDLLVSAPRDGKVWLLEPDADRDGRTDGKHLLLDELDNPHGMALHDGWLYVALGSSVVRGRFDAAARSVTTPLETVVEGLPEGGNHWTRTVGVGPDEKLYVSIGSSCNVCIEDDPRRAAMVRYELDGSDEQLWATGLRNAVDFEWHPVTRQLYATDNGRDLLGDDYPPCELNHVTEGASYGWPYANADRESDPDYGEGNESRVAASTGPVVAFGAHTAPLGIGFYSSGPFPARYHGAAFVALHGSWNRSQKQGYEVVAIPFGETGPIGEEPFMHGFEVNDDVIGRPVDAEMGPDGALYVSDDYTGNVYRVAYGEGRRRGAAGGGSAKGMAAPDRLAGLTAAERTAADDRGASLWEANDCGRCHVRGEAGAKPRLLSNLARRYGVDELSSFLASPQPPMPLYDLSETDRRALAVYLLGRYGAPN